MKRKIVIVFVIVIVSILVSSFLKTSNINEFYGSPVFQDIDFLEVTVYFSWQSKTFEVRDNSSVNEINNILSNMEIKRISKLSNSFLFEDKTSYNISFSYTDKEKQYFEVHIFDKRNMLINGEAYWIKDCTNIEKIYEITIMAQDPSSLDKYYYDMINK